MKNFDFINLANTKYIDEVYAAYLEDPTAVDSSWRFFFQGTSFAKEGGEETLSSISVLNLINAYRSCAHLRGFFNVFKETGEEPEELSLNFHGLTENDLEKEFLTFGLLSNTKAKLKDILAKLEKTYSSRIGYEFMHIGNKEIREFIQKEIEPDSHDIAAMSSDEKKKILSLLIKTEHLDTTINKKYMGKTRFSLEGGEAFIPLVSAVLDQSIEQNVKKATLGLAHRGRLNVLCNVLSKPYQMIFHEFEPDFVPIFKVSCGDVKYHNGREDTYKSEKGEIDVEIICNPSHLESVVPVHQGYSRALQDREFLEKKEELLPLIVHGDAAVAGQGVVYETMQMYKLQGYTTSGSIHITINNQIGYTTYPEEYMSTRYCTDIAKIFDVPIFHLNGDDPESCVFAAKLAVKIRQKFGIDVFLDFNCFRKYGHNEGDEPTYTQPAFYKKLKKRDYVLKLYKEKLIAEGVIDAQEAKDMVDAIQNVYEEALAKASKPPSDETPEDVRQKPSKKLDPLSEDALKDIVQEITNPKEDIQLVSKIKRILSDRQKMGSGEQKIDWGLAEHLAFASILQNGIPIRLSGEDSKRGTFSHRHAALFDIETEKPYYPLSNLSTKKAEFEVYNSSLSEYGAMGFEYGYSIDKNPALVVWEGQFGDFCNGAQIIIDQYLVSSEVKWAKVPSLVLLLPHGFEGIGPEHSSARLERFLQLSAEENIQVVMPSTSAQMFHLYRRQVEINKPLVIFSPKSLLRLETSLRNIDAFTSGEFQTVLDEDNTKGNTKRLMFCSGKVYYDLVNRRAELKKEDEIAIVRIEELYPFPKQRVKDTIAKYNPKECYFVQEEHKNAGSWSFIAPLIQEVLPASVTLQYAGREASASSAAGYTALHKQQLEKFLKEAFS